MIRFVTFLLVCFSLVVNAQERPFWKEIKAFKSADSLHRPPRKAIVFVGSSSFRMWNDVGRDFPKHTIINRGFGGSSLPHVIQYADEIVIPYKPKQVVVYCGENDFTDDAVTSEIVVDRFTRLFELLRRELPRATITFVSMKPSPSRQHLMPKIKVANEAIRRFLADKRRADFVSIWEPMLDANGNPRKELFRSDMLHMNADGYAIWQKALEPYLR
ncbi:MAG: GDSL-type esterase/lipase family protein [Bacteroidota bacterium]|nr:GDSL-type esterase/lipase family protein [Bacteroidota bacterium]